MNFVTNALHVEMVSVWSSCPSMWLSLGLAMDKVCSKVL